jgi:hypothetical protein
MSATATGWAVSRHGAALAMLDQGVCMPVQVRTTWTRHGTHRAYSEMVRRMMGADLARGVLPPDATDGALLVATRVEGGRIVERVEIPCEPSSDDAGAGVREPRRPAPEGGSASALAA